MTSDTVLKHTRLRMLRSFVALLFAITLASCGGGGGGGGNNGGTRTATPKSISGIVMLGPVASADVDVFGTGGLLVSTTTAADGTFGPVTFSGSYSGPLRITVTGNAMSTWVCDFYFGCPANNTINDWGDTLPFDGTLEAVLPSANANQFVSVSMLSTIAAARVDERGGLTSGNVNSANSDVSGSLNTIFEDTLVALGTSISSDFATVRLFDLQNPPAPTGADDVPATLLTLLNSGIMGLAEPTRSTGSFISYFTNLAAAQPNLPLSQPEFFDPSQESLLTVFLVQSIETYNRGGSVFAAIDALLAPNDLATAINAAIDTYNTMPSLFLSNVPANFFIDDAALQVPNIIDLPVTTSTGQQLGVDDIGVFVFPFSGGNWVDASIVMAGGTPTIRLELNNNVLATLPNGFYDAFVEVYSTTGEFRRDGKDITLNLSIVGRQVDAGQDQQAYERSSVNLSGSTNSPNDVASVNWVQTQGPPVTITNGDTFQPTVDLPSVGTDLLAELRLDVDFTTGERRSDFVNIWILAYPNIADLTFDDPVLQQCVTDTAAADNLVEVGEMTSLTCTGVTDITGLDVFANLTSLDLSGNSLTTLQPLLGLNGLQFLDISGNPNLPCNEIDQLAQTLEEGVSLIVDDICLGGFSLDLGAAGFDAALDEVRGQIYVSVPTRNEIAVISLTEFRIVDRLAMPGIPRGIDLSIDGTRLFAALYGSNAVAVVDIDQRSVSTIDLGVATDHETTWDVVEGEPDRLFVSANPGSGGLAYVAQVRLDQGNIASSVAGNTFIRSRPALARSPDQMFVYVGSGFSPNSLYKLSLADPDAPIVLEDDHGSVGGTDNLALNTSGTRIALGSGQVLRTGSFIEEGRVSGGSSVGSRITDTLFVAGANGVVEAFDFTTLAQTGSVDTSCDNSSTSRLLAFDNDSSFMLLQQESACLHASVSRSTPPDPYPNLRFTDLALEECVIATAVNMGWSEPEEFDALDCSLTPKTILSLEGMERFVNLTSLDISNSGVIDLSPLSTLGALQSLTVRDASVSDISALIGMTSLSTIDVTGNAAIPCTDLDDMVASGVSVVANQCTDTIRIELGGIGHDMVYDEPANRVFVSIPSLNRVSEIDLDTTQITQNFQLSAQPRGIDLGADRQTIYAALYNVGDIAILDTTTGTSQDVDISVELDDDRTWDVAEVSANRIVASTNPGSNGFGYIVEVRTDQGNAATRVAGNTIIRASPIFAVSPDQTAVYVGAGFSPNSLYKLDATQADLPIILEDDHGEVSGTASLALSPDGSRIYLLFGQVLSTDTFQTVARFPAGRSVVSADGTRLFVGDEDTDAARVYDLTTTGLVDNRQWGCDLLNLTAIFEYGDGVLVLGDDLVCFSRTVSYP